MTETETLDYFDKVRSAIESLRGKGHQYEVCYEDGKMTVIPQFRDGKYVRNQFPIIVEEGSMNFGRLSFAKDRSPINLLEEEMRTLFGE